MTDGQVRFERWSPSVVLDRSGEVLAVMSAALGPPEPGDDRLDTLRRHSQRPEFVFWAAVPGGTDGRLNGFAYGYLGSRGQWFPDQLAARLPSDTVDSWVGGHFEFVTLAVVPEHEGAGIGTRLHDELMADSPSARAILMTDATESRAVRLYRDRGWSQLGAFDADRTVYGRLVAPRRVTDVGDLAFVVDEITDADRFAWTRLFRGYLEFYERPDPRRVIGQVWSWLSTGEHGLRCLVARAEKDGAPIGLAHYRQIPRPILGATAGYLDDLFVDADWRGTGVFDALIASLRELGRSNGWVGVRWLTGPANARAQAAYDRVAVRKDGITFELPT
jgi:GNAT superfamily N-acetyltransferase